MNCSLIVFICTLICVVCTESPYHDSRVEDACNTASSVFSPWTGYRISRQQTYGAPRTTSLKLSYCWQGIEYASAAVQVLDSSWIKWGATMCLHDTLFTRRFDLEGCYKVVRRKAYVDLATPIYAPDSFVGGIFYCPYGFSNSSVENSKELCNDNTRVIPVAPLLADEPYLLWVEADSRALKTNTPVLYTPDKYSIYYPRKNTRWATYIDINEEYSNSSDHGTQEVYYERVLSKVLNLLSTNLSQQGFEIPKIRSKGDRVKYLSMKVEELLTTLAIHSDPYYFSGILRSIYNIIT